MQGLCTGCASGVWEIVRTQLGPESALELFCVPWRALECPTPSMVYLGQL